VKKIINGFRYDTDKAVEIGRHETGTNTEDHLYFQATLYKTKRSKRYFIAGYGGMMTLFNGKKRLIPLARKDAISFAFRFLDFGT